MPQKSLLDNLNLFKNALITYRNAVYQGEIDELRQTRKGFGIVYLAKTHDFICCNNWHNDILEGECLFYNDDKKYVYGTWINNVPQGFNVFRLDETIFMAEFHRGSLAKNTKIAIIFQRYNIGAILIVINEGQKLDDLELEVLQKRQVYSPEDVNKLFSLCQWPSQYNVGNQTIIKYLSTKLVSTQKYAYPAKQQTKLRLIQNKYYRFGYDEGLAIIFDEDYNRVSVGSHSKTKLKSFGITFNQNLQLKTKTKQGKIIKIQPQNNLLATQINNQAEKPSNTQKYQHLKANLLTGVNFCNKFYKNPSKLFFFYIQNILCHCTIKQIIAGSLTTRRMFDQTLDFTQQICSQQIKKTNLILPITHEAGQKNKRGQEKLLQDRLRLEAIKNQLYESLEKRKQIYQNKFLNEEAKNKIIHKEFIGTNNYQTPQRQKSRSRKRIFEQSQKNLQILRDFTPSKSEPNLTPFKAKMRNRIFNAEFSKISHAQDESDSNQKNNERFQPSKGQQKVFNYAENQNSGPQPLNYDSNKYSAGKHQNSHNSRSIQKTKKKDNETKVEDEINCIEERSSRFEVKKQKKNSFNRIQRPQFSNEMVQYIPINPLIEKERKKSTQAKDINFSNGIKSNDIRLLNQEQLEKNFKYLHKNHKNSSYLKSKKIIPQFKYYLEENSNDQFNQNPTFFHSRESQRQQDIFTHQNQDKAVEKIEKQPQKRRPLKQQPKHIDSFGEQPIYNEETFKQTAFRQQFESFPLTDKTRNNECQQKKLAYKHSNKVYLERQHKYSPKKQDQHKEKQFNRSTALSNSDGKEKTSTMRKNENPNRSVREEGSSYLQKHKIKRSIQRSIQRSPDRVRCYGKAPNNPYIEESPSYSKDYLHQINNVKDYYNKCDSQNLISHSNHLKSSRFPVSRMF